MVVSAGVKAGGGADGCLRILVSLVVTSSLFPPAAEDKKKAEEAAKELQPVVDFLKKVRSATMYQGTGVPRVPGEDDTYCFRLRV